MSSTDSTEQKGPSAQAVDEEYAKLERFQVERRKIVFVDHENPPQGGFGIVLRAELHESAYLPTWLGSRWYGPPQVVAVKQVKIPPVYNMPRMKRVGLALLGILKSTENDARQAFTRELLVWSSLEAHPGIATFLGFYADFKRSEAWFLSPWEPNGNVSEFIRKHNLEVPEKLSLVYDTIDALTFLHQRDPPVCHGDIKAANVLVGTNYKARLCDFGLARLHEDSGFGRLETSTGMKGSIRWCSPEILKDAPRAPTSDVYAWAWLVWEIMTGDLPYQGTTADYAIMFKIFESPLPEVDGQSRLRDCLQVWDLMMRCWNVEPGQRPTARMCKTTVTYLPRCTPTPVNTDHPTRSAALLENLGDLESWKGNLQKSLAYLDEAMRLYQEEADTKGVASVLRKQAAAAHRISDYVKLGTIATAALEHCRTLNDALGIADASFYLGVSVHMAQGKRDQALSILRESLEICRTSGNDVGAVNCLNRIAEIQRAKGLKQDALSTLDEAVVAVSRSGDRLGMVKVLHTKGNTYLDLSDFGKAAEALSEAIVIARNIGWEGGLSTTLCTMGGLRIQLGTYHEAEELLRESISAARRIGDRWRLAWALESLAKCFRRQSKPREAVSTLEEAGLLWHDLSRPISVQRVASTLVELKTSQKDWNGVLYWLDHIITTCRIREQQREVAERLEQKGQILSKLQRHDEAALHFEAALLAFRENGDFGGYLGKRRRRKQLRQLCAIPKVVMTWERRLPLLCDMRKLQRRLPQLTTASLKFSLPNCHGES